MKKIVLIAYIIIIASCGNKPGESRAKTIIPDSPAKVLSADTIQQPTTIKDIDGNVYNTVKIGRQTWMKENLRTTKLNDATPIQLVPDGSAWANTIKPSYCWYNNEPESYRDLYGALYNGFAASSSKLCPEYWHVPGDADWNTLSKLLGGDNIAGGKLKEAGFDYWVSPNMAANNATGFSALPGGLRYYDGVFHDFGFSAYFWSSEVLTPGRLWFRYMDYEYSDLFRFNNSANIGFSIRCVRDY